MIVPSVPNSLQLKMYGRVGLEDRGELSDGAVLEAQGRRHDRVEFEVVVHPLCGGEGGNLDDLTADEAQDVDRVASAETNALPPWALETNDR